MRFAFFGSSLLSAYWNGAATYYRGLLGALAERGHQVSFYEPDAYDRQKHRDIGPPEWADVMVYPPTADGMWGALEKAGSADVLVKCSGVGVFDEELERAVIEVRKDRQQVIFWDVDAPATLDRVQHNPGDPFGPLIPKYDAIFTYGGGDAVISLYRSLGAQLCVPIYNAVDPKAHHRVPREKRFEADLTFLGNRLPDRESRVEEFFLRVARALPERRFLLGGSGWESKKLPDNVRYIGHVYTCDHNALNSSSGAVLNINRESMATYGSSPPTRVFEAAGAAACIISDVWKGIEEFLTPGREVLVAEDGMEVVSHLSELSRDGARAIGDAAHQRVLKEHTYAHRAAEVDSILVGRNLSRAGI